MIIAVFGGLGTVCKEFLLQALAHEHTLHWFLQETDSFPDLPALPILKIICGSPNNILHYQEAIQGTDAVLVAFDPHHTEPTHWVYEQKMVQQAMRRENVRRLIVVTCHGSGDSRRQMDWTTWMHMNLNQIKYLTGALDRCWSILAQYTAQEHVVMRGEIPADVLGGSAHGQEEQEGREAQEEQGTLEWTILRPGLFVEGIATGTYLASSEDVFGGYVSPADVANCALKALEDDMDKGKCFSVAYSSRVA
ncbi:hypothetical protein LPJ66_010005 [Kickxella alabastrina]|uniref:Uncharacterized protein n=1 Tax=Kickxella alabastrina TaxID=61397 RepID=A0ACC1I1X9_9FUNG|nr:hypothetical protein LPJ66_010005 [Kickxella alabastrina]